MKIYIINRCTFTVGEFFKNEYPDLVWIDEGYNFKLNGIDHWVCNCEIVGVSMQRDLQAVYLDPCIQVRSSPRTPDPTEKAF